MGKLVIGKSVEAPLPGNNMSDKSSHSRKRGRYAGPPAGFIIERPVIYSGCKTGAFEDEKVLSVLDEVGDMAVIMTCIHVTILGSSRVRQIMGLRKRSSVMKVGGECRQFIDELPDRQYGHVGDVRLFGKKDEPYVGMALDWTGANRLGKDAAKICTHFGIPFDEGDYNPHVSVVKTYSTETAERIAGALKAIIKAPGGPDEIGFGGPQVLYKNTANA